MAQNANFMAALEYKTMIQERARLASEIHDGCAQTIGFLKLQAAQLRSLFDKGELDRAQEMVDQYYSTLSEVYQDARQAIDGLRVAADECGVIRWLTQTVEEFQELSGLPVKLEALELEVKIPAEVQAQLVRILQEALSNVRKHAQANQVWVACLETGADIILEIRDDGVGFSPEDVTSAARYGLRGMRERAELIGADFQVIAFPKEGTIVRVCLPVENPQEVIA